MWQEIDKFSSVSMIFSLQSETHRQLTGEKLSGLSVKYLQNLENQLEMSLRASAPKRY
ncbi:uncharacterized protein J3R85_006530 [Psidium guajava]|nr:uncharacterized protein J3R85_006530 [Psidium guajava]